MRGRSSGKRLTADDSGADRETRLDVQVKLADLKVHLLPAQRHDLVLPASGQHQQPDRCRRMKIDSSASIPVSVLRRRRNSLSTRKRSRLYS